MTDDQMKADVEERFDRDFNFLPLDVVWRIADRDLAQYIRMPSATVYGGEEWYPMWGTVFEARSRWHSQWLETHVDELYDIGIGVIENFDSFNAMLFIAGAGYNFYDHHWVPLYRKLLGR